MDSRHRVKPLNLLSMRRVRDLHLRCIFFFGSCSVYLLLVARWMGDRAWAPSWWRTDWVGYIACRAKERAGGRSKGRKVARVVLSLADTFFFMKAQWLTSANDGGLDKHNG